MNGKLMNGTQLNGIELNGVSLNGKLMNGTALNGLQLSGTMLTGTLVDAPMCAHSESVAGAPLPSTCNACAGIVCAADAHCCGSAWDATCVSEAKAQCAITGSQLAGNGTLSASMLADDGSTVPVTLRIDSIQQPDYWVTTCTGPLRFRTCHTVNMPWLGPNKDVNLYAIEYSSQATSCVVSCGKTGCQTVCTTQQTWQPICPYTDNEGYSNLAIPVAGAWESRVGYFTSASGKRYGGGGKIPDSDATTFTFGCRDHSAIGKCLERVGYKPWLTGTVHDGSNNPLNSSLEPSHEACVRMLRADYCGDGQAHTRDGTPIDVADGISLQSQTTGLNYGIEAEWNPQGASCVSWPRFNSVDASCDPTSGVYSPSCPSPNNYTTGQYVWDHCPANYRTPAGGACGTQASDLLYTANVNWMLGLLPVAYMKDWSSTLPNSQL